MSVNEKIDRIILAHGYLKGRADNLVKGPAGGSTGNPSRDKAVYSIGYQAGREGRTMAAAYEDLAAFQNEHTDAAGGSSGDPAADAEIHAEGGDVVSVGQEDYEDMGDVGDTHEADDEFDGDDEFDDDDDDDAFDDDEEV